MLYNMDAYGVVLNIVNIFARKTKQRLMKKIRIFISSPGDVMQERNIARSVITELNDLYSKYVELELLMWEDFPLSADSTFQEGINFFLSEDRIDVAIFILWSRLGTPLCSKFTKPDGSHYKSGTEYEFDMMMQLFKEKGWPRILTYIKNSEFKPNVSSLKELEDILRQKEYVDTFIHEYFHDETSNSNYAYLQFGDSSSFEQKFRMHLTNTIKSMIGNVGEIREWEGNPYVGLNSFEYEQSSIFFGRKQLVYETASKLVDFNDVEQKKSLIVLGESGSGKSSFIKAGLLPFLCREKSGGNFVIVSPSAFGGNFYQGLLDLLVDRFSFLKDNPFVEELRENIDDETNFKHLSYAFAKNENIGLILYVDQFEELFSDSQISEEERLRVILLLKGLVSTKKLSVFISMRSDYYNRFSQYGNLNQLKEDCVLVDIPMIGHSEFKEIVEEPAKKASLRWEVDDNANALNERIVKDAMAIKDLPLIEFALSELYKLRDENECLTFEAYEKIGGLKGAMVAYADNFYSALSPEEKDALSIVLGFVIAYSSSGLKNTYVRKTSLMKDVCSTDVQKSLVKKLVDAHLLIAGKDSNGHSTITIVHETLIRHWSVVKNWIEQQKDFLESSVYYEQRAQHWANAKKSSRDLIIERTALLEAEYFLYKYSKLVSAEVNEFLYASIKKERRKGIVWQTAIGVLLLFGLFSIAFLKITGITLPAPLNEWLGDFNNTSLLEYLWMYIPMIGIIAHSLCLRYAAKPIFKTIKYSLWFWAMIFAHCLIFDLTNECFSEGIVFALLIDGGVLAILLSTWYDFRRRKLWKNKKKVDRRISEKWMERLKWGFTIVLFLISFLYFSYIISEAQSTIEKNEKLLNANSETFDIFFSVTNTALSPADNLSVNNILCERLETHFYDELTDTVYDAMEIQYATCLYNLKYPEQAIKYLYWEYAHEYLFGILCLMQSGYYNDAETFLELCVEAKVYVSHYWYATEQLIWIAEKLGRFDLAEQLYEIVKDNDVDMSDLSFLINRAHIHMAKGELEDAVNLYKYGLNYNVYSENVRIAIEQDFHTFSYFNSISDEKLLQMAKTLDVSFRPSYTVPDSMLTEKMYETLLGSWLWHSEEDTALYVKLMIDKDVPLARSFCYTYSDSTYIEHDRFVSLLRFEEREGDVLWDEYYPENDGNSYGRICERSDEYFVLEIMENGNPKDKGKKRKYVKIDE